MMRITKAALLMFVFVFAGALSAQIPKTPAGRQFQAWQKAQDSGDRAVIQEFINKSMSFGRVDQELAIHNQSGGYDVKRVLESDDTHIVVLAQERGATRQFVKITFNVAPSEPYGIAGIGIQITQPPPDLAPPKMTESEAGAARKGAPFLQFSAWLDVFNSGDRARMQQFLADNAPALNLDNQMNFRERTGGFELRGLEQATPASLTGLVQERNSDQFGRFVIVVDAAEPHQITRFGVNAIPRPADFPVARMSETGMINALRTKLETDTAAGRFAGTVLVAKNGNVLFSAAYGLADRDKMVANTLDTRFRIGSMNKMFTAVSILQLVQAGKIKLMDTVGKYIPDYPNQDVASKVTIHHLLTHTGGTGDIFGPEFNAHRLDLRTLKDYVDLYGKRAPAYEPGSRYAYSNYGMLLLGFIVERVSGQSY